MPVPTFEILDGSGGMIKFTHGNDAAYQYGHAIHVDAFDDAGVYAADPGGAEPSVFDTAINYMGAFARLIPTDHTLRFLGAYRVVAGRPEAVPIAETVSPVPAAGYDGSASDPGNGPASETTIAMHDTIGNIAFYHVLYPDVALWVPGEVRVFAPVHGGTKLQSYVAYLVGGPAGIGGQSHVRSHAGGVLQGSGRFVSTLNQRLRRRFHLT